MIFHIDSFTFPPKGKIYMNIHIESYESNDQTKSGLWTEPT